MSEQAPVKVVFQVGKKGPIAVAETPAEILVLQEKVADHNGPIFFFEDGEPA